jgi:hypothetical protein
LGNAWKEAGVVGCQELAGRDSGISRRPVRVTGLRAEKTGIQEREYEASVITTLPEE